LALTDFLRERGERIERLQKWLSLEGFDAAVFLKEDMELNNYNYVYYGGYLASDEYAALIVDVSGDTSVVVQEHAFERVRSGPRGTSAELSGPDNQSLNCWRKSRSLSEDIAGERCELTEQVSLTTRQS
jgi:hypothetical protein